MHDEYIPYLSISRATYAYSTSALNLLLSVKCTLIAIDSEPESGQAEPTLSELLHDLSLRLQGILRSRWPHWRLAKWSVCFFPSHVHK